MAWAGYNQERCSGFALGPLLLNIFISDPEEVAELTIIRFAAQSKMVGAINTLGKKLLSG